LLKIKKSNNLVYVDKQGVLRYSSNNAEAAFFGVNYTTAFAYAYRAHKALNVDLEKAIQQDVYHMARLGLDAFRVHVWDTEISDTLGNLIAKRSFALIRFPAGGIEEEEYQNHHHSNCFLGQWIS
jgi:hypothetical protein